MPRTLLGDKKIIRTIFEALSVKRTLPPHLDFTMTKAQAKPILLPPIYDVSAAPTPSNPTGNINKGLLLPSEWGSTGICADSNGHILLRFVHRNLPTPFRLHLRCHPSWQSVLFWPLKGREDTTVLIVRVALDLFRVSMPMGSLISTSRSAVLKKMFTRGEFRTVLLSPPQHVVGVLPMILQRDRL